MGHTDGVENIRKDSFYEERRISRVMARTLAWAIHHLGPMVRHRLATMEIDFPACVSATSWNR